MIQLNLQPLKEPRGVIRIVQIAFAIMAFASTGRYDDTAKVQIKCPDTGVVVKECTDDVPIKYPFRDERSIGLCGIKKNCSNDGENIPGYSLNFDYGTSAEFYVTTGVLSFLYAIIVAVFYVFGSALYDENPILPFFDFLATALLSLFWFVGWIAWVAQFENLKSQYYDLPSIICHQVGTAATCQYTQNVHFSSLTVSLIAGFGSLAFWIGSSWFVYKETHFFKKDSDIEYAATSRPNNPIA